MGVSEWRELGKLWGYWEFFVKECESKAREEGRKEGAEAVLKAVDKTGNCNSQAHRETQHAGDCDWCEKFREAARKACEEAAKK